MSYHSPMVGRWIVILMVVAGCFAAACERKPAAPAPTSTPVAITNTPQEQCDPVALTPPPTAASAPVGELQLKSIDGSYALRITMSPDPVKLNELFSMLVHVQRAEGTSPEHFTISASAAMPQHGHGMTVLPRVTPSDEGGSRVEGMMLHMPGAWTIALDITEGAITERASFVLEVH